MDYIEKISGIYRLVENLGIPKYTGGYKYIIETILYISYNCECSKFLDDYRKIAELNDIDFTFLDESVKCALNQVWIEKTPLFIEIFGDTGGCPDLYNFISTLQNYLVKRDIDVRNTIYEGALSVTNTGG